MLFLRPQFLSMLSVIMFLTSCTTVLSRPVTGSASMEDPYYANLGNGGYEVQHYAIALNVDPIANTVEGAVDITATSSQYLESFNLDFHGLTVDSITVNNLPAEFSHEKNELTIHPANPLDANQLFNITVHYHGSPGMITTQAGPFEMGWSHAESGAINVWGEPDAASTWFPNNNHPRDKATFRFEIAVPQPWLVAASGTLKETNENGEQTTFVWEMDKPMATYLASINIDQYELVTQTGPNGMTIRNYLTQGISPSQREGFNILPAAIDFFDDLFGPYPFEEYGVVIAHNEGFCSESPTALETQSMSLHCPSPVMTAEWVIVHELAHQWFGDSISIENWKDIWLKEGLATYSEWIWESRNDLNALDRIARQNVDGYYETGLSVAEPAADNLYSSKVYTGGALVFHALRLEVGDEDFFNILRTYTERYRDSNAGTDEFMALAEDVSGKDLKPFFDAWLFSETLPDFPE